MYISVAVVYITDIFHSNLIYSEVIEYFDDLINAVSFLFLISVIIGMI